MVILALILGLLLGAGCAWMVTRSRSTQVETELTLLRRAGDERPRSSPRRGTPSRRSPPRRYRQTSSAFLEIAKIQLSGLRGAAEGVARADGRPDERDGEGAPGGVRRRHPASEHACEHAGAPPARDRQPRQGAADAARARPLGRDAAPARRRAGGHARPTATSRSRVDARRPTTAGCDPTCRPAPGRQRGRSSTPRPRSRRTWTRARRTDDAERARAISRSTRARCASTSASSAQKSYWQAVRPTRPTT